MKDGAHHKFKPLIKEGEKVCRSVTLCLFDGIIFLDNMKHQCMCYDFIPRKNKEGSSEVLVEVSSLLSEYGDVISNNVIEGLPLVRKISHQIDLVPGAIFPNKATDRIIPTKTKELNRQVQDFLRKGLI